MGLPNVMQTGRSGMMAAQAGIATSGHNITNSKTPGYTRQRVTTEAKTPVSGPTLNGTIGTGVDISRIERVNDEYLERQLQKSGNQLSHFEEKGTALRQVEDIFNEMGGDGLNRILGKFFNDFRKLANDPNSEAIRQSVRESSRALTNDFHRIRNQLNDVVRNLDARLEAYSSNVNVLAEELSDLNLKINEMQARSGPPNDLLDRRDQIIKEISDHMEISPTKDENGNFYIDIPSVGPFVANSLHEKLYVQRSPADDMGKPENAFELRTTASANANVTHVLKGGKIGALLNVRDQVVSRALARLDALAYQVSNSVNEIHRQGYTRTGVQGVDFFSPIDQVARASEKFDLSDAIKASASNIATAVEKDAPGDNRVAVAISGLQHLRIMADGHSSMDDWYNSIVSDVGIVTGKNKEALNQQKSIQEQLSNMRETISGVSIDEETANLLQYQHAFDASAKVIAVADQLMQTVLALKPM